MKTIIIGLGNPFLSDDGVGIIVANEIKKLLVNQNLNGHNIAVTTASVGGLRLMEMMVGFDRAILIDSLVTGGRPGTIQRMTLSDLSAAAAPQHLASAHDANLPTAVAAGRLIGLFLPQEIVIYAIECANVKTFGEALTTAVAEAVPHMITAVLDEI